MKPGSVVTLGLCNINTLKKSYMCDKHASKLENVLQHMCYNTYAPLLTPC